MLGATVGCAELVERSSPPDTTTTEAVLPLQEVIGFSSVPRSAEMHYSRLQTETDGYVVTCMARQGLRFVPRGATWLANDTDVDAGSRAWAERNGLGITEAFRQAEASLQGADPRLDPNATYLATLSDADRDRWNEALYGDLSDLGDTSQGSVAYEPGGCQGAAFARAFTQNQLFEQFGEEVKTLDARIEADPRLVGFMKQWSSCMAELGHDYDNKLAMTDDVYAALLGAAGSPQALDELAARERDLAVLSHDCSESFADEVFSIRTAYEREFINDNRVRIEAAVQAQNSAVGAP